MIQLGIIADDFTGASDIASFLVENGLRTVQMNGIPQRLPRLIGCARRIVASFISNIVRLSTAPRRAISAR